MTRAALLRVAAAAALLFAVVRLADPAALQTALAGADSGWLAAGRRHRRGVQRPLQNGSASCPSSGPAGTSAA